MAHLGRSFHVRIVPRNDVVVAEPAVPKTEKARGTTVRTWPPCAGHTAPHGTAEQATPRRSMARHGSAPMWGAPQCVGAHWVVSSVRFSSLSTKCGVFTSRTTTPSGAARAPAAIPSRHAVRPVPANSLYDPQLGLVKDGCDGVRRVHCWTILLGTRRPWNHRNRRRRGGQGGCARAHAITHECGGVPTEHTCGHQLVRDERYAHDLHATSNRHRATCIVHCGSAHGK